MKSIHSLLIILSLVISIEFVYGVALLSDFQRIPQIPVPYQTKRSLCNTFGGCGAKRSLQQLPVVTDSSPFRTDRVQDLKRDARAELLNEILTDLIEYLRNNEKYREGKYTVMVPKLVDIGPNVALNNQGADLSLVDLQELQVLKRND